MPKRPQVSFVVLNWNGLDDTLRCLDSIRAQTIEDFEIIVVDNGSAEEQKDVLRGIDDIELIDFPKNTGFTGGQNAAYEIAKGDFIALINNDAVVAKDWASQALNVMERNPKVAALGGRAYQWDKEKGQEPFDKNNPFYSYQVVSPVTGHARTVTYGDKECSVNSISGSGVMIRRKAAEQTGYFYNRFFAYYEETDLFARFKRAGWQIMYSPDVHTWHQIAKSTRAKPKFYLYQMHRNRFIFALRNYDSRFAYKFFRHYIKEYLQAIKFIARHGRANSIEQQSLSRAFSWNMFHLPATLISRREIQTAGSRYSLGLLDDKGESITVVIPCHNYGQYVGEAINSALDQSLPPDEIIVINDGSTDDSLEKINKFKTKVRVIDQKNMGVIATKNKGLDEASGDWVIFLDADDKMHTEYIEKLYNTARLCLSDIVYSGMEFIGSHSDIFESRPFTERSLKKGNYINNSALMRREMVLKVGGYKQQMDFGFEDWELYISLAEAKARFRHVNEALLYYRRHETTSRDIQSWKKLRHAHETVRRLHPGLFTLKHRTKDIIYTLLTIHQRRTPLQMIKDFRYTIIKKIDRVGERNMIVNKMMGFGRLLMSGDFLKIWHKIKLNLRRLSKR